MADYGFNDSNPCPDTTNVTTVSGFQAMLAVEVIMSICGLVPNALMVVIVARARVFHTNLRLLLAHLNLILFTYSAAQLAKSLSVLITVSFGDVCSLAMKLYDCKLREFPVAFPNNALTYSSFAICLERIYCTILYKKYDKNGAKPWLAMALIFITWIVVITNQLLNLYGTSQTKMTAVCENLLSVTPASSTGTLIPQMTLEAAIVISSLAVHLYNKQQLNSAFLNRSKMTLSARFQMDQNVQLNRIVTPSMIFEAICFIPIMLLLMLLNRGYEMPQPTKVILVHFSYIWKLAFCCVQPLISFYENPHLNKGLRKVYGQMMFLVLNSKGQVSPGANDHMHPARSANAAVKETEVYFRNLEQQWSVPMKQLGDKSRHFLG